MVAWEVRTVAHLQPATQSKAARQLLQEMLAKHGITESLNVILAKDANGKPYLTHALFHNVSLAHSGTHVAAAISESPIGIDIEIIKTRSTQLLNKVSTLKERTLLLKAGMTGQLLLTALWVLKEAVIKAERELIVPTECFVEAPLADDRYLLTSKTHPWQVQLVRGDTYCAAIATPLS